jgi:hypothetical protein
MRSISTILLGSLIALGVAGAAMAQDAGAQPQGQGARQGPRGGGGGARGAGGPGAAGAPRTPPPPAQGGTIGVVDSVSPSSFTVTTPAGMAVIVEQGSATTYRKGTSKASARAVKKGESVLVFGLVNVAMGGAATKPTITASQVVVHPPGAAGSATLSTTNAGGGFRTLAPKQVGLMPIERQGQAGVLVSGPEADKATEAALAAFTGGIVNRVTRQSDTVYDVHNAAVSWPHNIFIDQDFKYLGAR